MNQRIEDSMLVVALFRFNADFNIFVSVISDQCLVATGRGVCILFTLIVPVHFAITPPH